ncbi:hypothetical protein [Paenibacillus maysiensis]|uniref:hypothetical protein n=1 Tax=Paenibacillus maysiensis TaxID=1155954 RepID=UPI0004B95CF1|nr:hypothetical protein [Paenibacillus maysiensis]
MAAKNDYTLLKIDLAHAIEKRDEAEKYNNYGDVMHYEWQIDRIKQKMDRLEQRGA